MEVGEHYYSPMTTYLEAERGSRGETPGALTYSERLARKWIYGRRYDSEELRERYSRFYFLSIFPFKDNKLVRFCLCAIV